MSEIDNLLQGAPAHVPGTKQPKPVAQPESEIDALLKEAPAPSRGFKGWARDVAGTAINSAIGVPEAVVGLADIPTGGQVGKFLENEGGAVGFRPKQAKEFVNETIKSDASREARRKFAEADGIVDKTVAAVQNPSLIVEGVGESLGAMGAGGVAARGLMAARGALAARSATQAGMGEAAAAKVAEQAVSKAAPWAGAGGEGLAMAGSAAEQIRQETDDGLLTPAQSGIAAATGLAGAALGVGGAKLAQRLGVGDADTMLAQGMKGINRQNADEAATAATNPLVQQQAAKSIPRSVIEGAISEGLFEELPQSVTEQVLQNIALGKDWHQDVDAAVVMGALSGGAMGGAAAGYRSATRPGETEARAPAPPAVPPAPGQPPQPGPVLGLPAPDRGVIEVASDGTARTPAYQAPGYVGDVTDVEPKAIDPVREQVATAAAQGGALSSAALTAIDTGAAAAVQPAEPEAEQAPPQISLEEADARDRAAYEQFFASADADPVVGRYFENDDDIPDFDAASNVSDEDFLRSLGATDEDIQDAIATAIQPAIPQSRPAVDAGAQANEPAGTQEGAGADQAAQGQVAPRQPGNFTGTPTATMGQQGATARPGPGFGLKDALAQIRTKKQQEAANAQAATPESAPATTSVSAARPGAVETAGPAPDVKAITAKQIPDMTDVELQQAIAHYGPAHKRTPKLQKEVQRRAATVSPTTEGTANVPQADQAQQAAAQPAQAGPAQPAQGLTDGAATQHHGAQGTPAPGAQAQAPGNANWEALTPEQRRRARLEHEIATGQTNNGGVVASLRPSAIEKRKQELAAMGDAGKLPSPGPAETREQRAQRVAAAGEAWTRMRVVEREALAARAEGLNPIQRKRVPGAVWADLNSAIQRKLADAMGGRAETGGNQTPAGTQQAQAATENVATQPVDSIFTGKPDAKNSAALDELEGFKAGDTVEVEGRTIGRSTIEMVYRRQMAGFGMVPMARVVGADGKKLDVLLSDLTRVEAAAEATLDEQLKQVNDELDSQGQVINARTRAKRDQIRKAIAERDFPAILKAVDGDVGSAEAINQALQFAGDEPKAKVIERVLKNRGISDEYRQRWAERLMGDAGAQGAAPTPSPGVVNIPPVVSEALENDLRKQKARAARLRTAAAADGTTLDEKRAAQLKVTAAEATLRQMRTKIFDAEDAVVASVKAGNPGPFSNYADLFPGAEQALVQHLLAMPAEPIDVQQVVRGAVSVQKLSKADTDAAAEILKDKEPAAAPAKPAPKKKPSADQTRAKADLMAALADLGDILGKNTRMNITPEQEVKLLPVLTRVLDAAFRLGYHKFKDAAKFALDQIRANLGDEAADALTLDQLQGAYIAMAGGKQGTDTKRAVIDVETKAEIEAHEAQADDETQEGAADAPDAKTLTESLYQAIGAGNMPKDNPALKKLVEAFDGKPADPARMKQAQEELETAIAMAARDIVAKGQNDKATFDELLRMYESQPNLNIRTSTSVANQAYSTPAPLAFLASRLAGITRETVAHEPTGGTGMLLIGADPKKALVNELNDLRISALKAQGFSPTQKDAATMLLVPEGTKSDAVVTNPPFGSVKDADGKPVKVKVDGFSIGQIDHLIAARALQTMKDDGKATLILGANKVAGGLSTDDRIFFNWLYSHYNVSGHFEVEGDLYARQGAGWPVRVITINGRQKSGQWAPVAGTIQRADNWSQVYEQFTKILDGADTAASTSPAPDSAGGGAVAAVTAPAAPGGLRPKGGAGGAGNVAGAGPRAVPDSAEPAAEPVGSVPDEQRINAQSHVPQPQPGQDTAGPARPAQPAGTAALDPSKPAEGNEFQAPYTPRSARKDEGVLIPANMAQPIQDALSKLEDEVGDIDEFARSELGYATVADLHHALMGLQVDSVAMSIHQIKKGKAVVIADQTGIGKGRQAASIIRWAARQGFTPVFVSVKPSLFTDMYGDLADIGTHDVQPFIMNGDAWVAGEDGTKLFANKPAGHKNTIQRIADTGQLPDGRNAVFMTYSQINVDNVQRKALMALASNAVFVLDESHNAAGASATGDFVIGALDAAKGVTYLSATYAKRPDNMPLYFKTDIGDAAADADGLALAMSSGGLPLQTVVSNNLVKAGQMFRRERSYDGVSILSKYDTPHRALHERMSDEATKALRAIVSADSQFHEGYVKMLKEELAALGSTVQDSAGNQLETGVQHTEFSSVVHNFVKQMLLGLKAQAAADDAIESLRRGEKPIIAVENTMGSFLTEYAAAHNIGQGDSLGSFDYRTVLTRALARSRVIIEVGPTGDKVKRPVPLSELDAGTRAAYDEAQKVIDGLTLDIPVSPIDWMRAEITRAGYQVAEITGRSLSVDYSDPKKPVLAAIDLLEQKDKVNTTRQFNAGKLDALILNVAGSTGISLHASEKFEDQRQRHMIVAQAAGDINIFMQMLGRVHRTGQVRLPKYTILSVDLPTEKRPTAVLSIKMKSLNANTSSNTESATSVKSSDILNKYGDQIVNQYLQDNAKLARELGLWGEVGQEVQEDIARKATGRLALQPIEVQHGFYDEVESQYAALIDYLNKTNQNDLEPRTFDFDAKETRQEVLFDGPNKDTPFGEDAIYGEYSIKAQGAPMTPAEIQAAMAESLGDKTPAKHVDEMLEQMDNQYKQFVGKLAEASRAAAALAAGEYDSTKDDAIGDTLSLNKIIEAAGVTRQIGIEFLRSHAIGKTFRIDINSEPFNAVVTNIRSTHKATGNPYSMSKIQVTVAVNGALRSVSVPATQFHKIEVSSIAPTFRVETLFKEQPPNQRETAKIVTGNLLAAYGELQGVRGTIISFTKQDGTSEQGILLPKLFDFTKNTRGDYRLPDGAAALAFLQKSQDKDIGRFGIMSRDGLLRVLPSGQGVRVQVPKSKLKGAKYFLDKGLIASAGDFVSSGGFMVATVYEPDGAVKVLDLLMKKQALYALPSMADEAKRMVGDKGANDIDRFRSAPAANGQAPIYSSADSTLPAKPLSLDRVNQLVQEALSGIRGAPPVEVTARPGDIGLKVPAGSVGYGVTLRSGDIYVFQSAMGSDLDVFKTVFHELFHRGVRVLVPKAQYVQTMLDLAKGDSRIQQLAIEWKNTEMGQKQKENLRKQGYTGAELTGQYEALAIEEALAAVAEEIKAEGRLGSKPKNMTIRYLANWLAKVADMAGMKKLAQGIRAMTYNQAERFVMSAIDRSGAPVPRAGVNNMSTKDGAPGVSEFQQRLIAAQDMADEVKSTGQRLRIRSDGTVSLFHSTSESNANAIRAGGTFKGNTWFSASKAATIEHAKPKHGKSTTTIEVAVDPRHIEFSTGTGEFYAPDGLTRNDAGVWVKPNESTAPDSGGAAFSRTPGDFDPDTADIRFRSADLRGLKASAIDQLHQTLSHPGKVSLWDKTVGTMRNLAERNPAFKPVFEAAQQFIDDVAMMANDAAEMAPRLLPRVETWRDLRKNPISAQDNKAVARPLFDGTLLWGRDVDGKPVLVRDLESKYANLSADDKAQMMLKAGRIDPGVLKMWRGLPLDQYESAVNTRFSNTLLKAGVVWTDQELKDLFQATPEQVSLYREARKAIDRSIDMTSRADMLRLLGEPYAPIRDVVLEAPTLTDAMTLLVESLEQDAKENPDDRDRLAGLMHGLRQRQEKAAELMAQGYAPLSRFGRYTVDVVDAAGERQYFGMFETAREANQMALRMRSTFQGAKVTQGTMSQEAYKLFAGITPESLEMFGNMLGLDSEGSDSQDKAFQEYLRLTKNNHSALKRLIHRQGIAGYSEDVGRVLASFVYSNARQAAGALNAGTVERAIGNIPKEQGELKDVAMGLQSYIRDPQEEGQAIRGMLFAQYLGGSVASAFVNMTQPFQITLPWLSQYGGMKSAGAQLARAVKDMARRGHKYEADLAQALKHAEDDGVVSPQEIQQLMAQARGSGSLRAGDGTRVGDLRAKAGNQWEKTKVLWGQPFALAEQFNRRSTFIAAYRLAKEQGKANPAEFARRAVLETQFLYSKANKPRWARGAIGGTVFTFKTYSVSYLELMHRMWNQGEPGSPERSAGRRAVGWAVAMLLLMGGAGGLPFMEDAEDLIDGAGQLMGHNVSTKQWRMALLRDVLGKELAEFIEQGVSGLPGAPVDVSGRLGMGNLIPGTGLFLDKPNRTRDMTELVGPAGDLISRGFTGARKALTGDLAGAALEVSPVAVRNVAKGADMAASGIYKDTKGYKVIDTTLDEALAKAIGFQPKPVAQVQEAAGFMQRSRSFYVKTSSEIKAKWAQALFNKDEAALEDVRERLAAWNRNNPEQPIVVKMPDVWKRVREMGKDRNQRIAETAPKALREQMRNMARENV